MPYSMRKLTGKDMYKVFNVSTGEIKSNSSTKKDAKSQLRILRALEKKEQKGGSLKAEQIKDVIDLSYDKKSDKAPSGYVLDKSLSDDRVKVYKDMNSNQVIVAHRGSKGWRDWLDNAYYARYGNVKNSGTYNIHKGKHNKALEKYGAENVISVGHSRAGKYVEELNRDNPVKEVITYNKAVGVHDAFQKNPSNQTDIRSSRDPISSLSMFQRGKNKVVNIASNTLNPLKAHGTSALGSLGDKLLGKGFKGGRFNPKAMRVGDMRKFIKAFKSKRGEKFTGGSKLSKVDLATMIKPMLEDDDIDEMIGGSIWTDFVKDFSAKHSLKYACSLSKYKEPLKKAYKLFKDKKDWYEPMKIDQETATEPAKKNIKLVIEKKKPEPMPEPEIPLTPTYKPPTKKGIDLDQIIEELDNTSTFPILLYQSGKFNNFIETIEKLVEKQKMIIVAYLFSSKIDKDLLNGLFTYWSGKVGILGAVDMIDKGGRSVVEYFGGEDLLPASVDYTEYLKNMNTKNKKLLYDAIKKKTISGSGIMSGGNVWTDFVKEYAKLNATTYGCALSDFNIKGAYKLFKDGKTWFFPKSSVIETQTDEFIEPEPTKAPDNIEPAINRINEKIVELEALGAKNGAVSYDASAIVGNMLFLNMMKKYGGKCIVNDVMNDKAGKFDIGIIVNSNPNYSDIRFPVHVDRLAENLKECIGRGIKLILIPTTLHFGKSRAGHANLLVYRPFKRLVERFEPHGHAYGNSMVDNASINKQLRKLFEEDLTKELGQIRYREPSEICPNTKGFQSLEGTIDRGLKKEGGGFCSMWSIFFAELLFINPDKTTKEIYQEVFDITKSEPMYLKSLIRGYVLEAEKELDVLLKMLSSSGFSFKGRGQSQPYMQLISKYGELTGWLLETIFDTKKYSEAPPDFEPLPDAELKDVDDEAKLKETFYNKIVFLTKEHLENIYHMFNRKFPKGKKDDIAHILINNLFDGTLSKSGATGLEDIDVILSEELYKKKLQFGLSKSGYFIDKKKERDVDVSGGRFSFGKMMNSVTSGLNKINPMMIAINNPKSSKAMRQSGELTNDYLLPAVVSAGKPVYDASALTASMALTGTPAGKIVADELWNEMVAKKGIDPRKRQKSEMLGDIAGRAGTIAGREGSKKFK